MYRPRTYTYRPPARTYRPPSYDRYRRGSNSRCASIEQRIRVAESEIPRLEYTGEHQKALRWYYEDRDRAYAELDACRYGPGYSGGFRPYQSYGGGFDWSTQWPSLLGSLLPTQ